MNKFSLRYQLILPFVFLVLLVPAAVGWMLFDAGATAVNGLTRRVLMDVTQRINAATEQHLIAALNVLSALTPDANAQPATQPFSNDLPSLEKRIWSISGLYPQAGNYTYFGGKDGRFVGIYRINNYLTELYLRPPGARQRHVYAVSHPGNRVAVLRSDHFDPRRRPWYIAAVRQEHPVWSPVYSDFTSGKATITVARSVRDASKIPIGVLAVDVELKALTDFLGSLTISKNGVAFVMDGTGHMIASSDSQPPFVLRDGRQESLRADEMNSPMIRAAWAKVLEWKNAQTGSQEPLALVLESPAGTVDVAASVLGEKQGLDWVTVAVAPRSDFMGGVTRSFANSIGVAVACILLALLLGMGIINRVLRDIYSLNNAARKIGVGEPLPALDIHRKDEIGQLARTFNEMEHNLRTDNLTGAYNREFLFTRIRLLQQQANSNVPPPAFALLFIDLDNFKPINDQYGHDAGDQALRMMAARLKTATRASDVVVRYGGDEFVVLLNEINTFAQVAAAMAKIRTIAEQPMRLGQDEITLGFSVGWALFPEDGKDTETLLKIADTRMFETKKTRKAGLD